MSKFSNFLLIKFITNIAVIVRINFEQALCFCTAGSGLSFLPFIDVINIGHDECLTSGSLGKDCLVDTNTILSRAFNLFAISSVETSHLYIWNLWSRFLWWYLEPIKSNGMRSRLQPKSRFRINSGFILVVQDPLRTCGTASILMTGPDIGDTLVKNAVLLQGRQLFRIPFVGFHFWWASRTANT